MPYQLHCAFALQADETALLELEEATLFTLDLMLETELDDELFIELELTIELELFTGLDALVATELLDATAEHTAPVMIGCSDTAPLVSP